MLREILFVLIYFLCFIGLSVLGIKLSDERSNEMLGFALWGGLFYAASCFIPWIIINRLSLLIESSKLRYIGRFLAGLLVLYMFVILTSSSAGTMNLKICLAMHVIYILSFVFASASYAGNSTTETESEPGD